MARSAQQQSHKAEKTSTRPVEGFKPVALPALAAALRPSRAVVREVRPQDIPAVLRKSAYLD